MDFTDKFVAILHLDNDAHLRYSENTKMWYVHAAMIEMKQGGVLRHYAPHGETPEEAVNLLFNGLTNLEPDQILVVDAYGDNPREFAWDSRTQNWVRLN